MYCSNFLSSSEALVNALFLVAFCFSIRMESSKLFYKSEEIHDPNKILIVHTLGLLALLPGLSIELLDRVRKGKGTRLPISTGFIANIE